VTAQALDGSDREIGPPYSVTFDVAPVPVTSLFLVKTMDPVPVLENLSNSSVVNRGTMGLLLTVCAEAAGAERVRFTFDSLVVTTDTSTPFCIQDDYNLEYAPLVSFGTHTMTAVALDSSDVVIGPLHTVTYVVAPVLIEELSLIDTTEPLPPLGSLLPMSEINITEVGTSLTVCAVVDGANRVAFRFDGVPVMIDNSYPFCIDDNRDQPFSGIAVIGPHDLTAQALDENDNPIGPVQLISFNVVGAVRRRRRETSADFSVKQRSISNGLVKSSFEGASGPVLFHPEKRLERDPTGLIVGLYNIHPKPSTTTQTSKNYYTTILLSCYTQQNGWKDLPGAVQLNRDGSSYSPTLSRRYFESNYLSQGVRVVGLILLSIAWFLAFGLLALIIWMKNEPIIVHGNLLFLQLLCLGSAVLSTTILTLSWDESTGWSDRQLDAFCTLTPWFYFSGHTVHTGAMFMIAWHWNVYNDRSSSSFSPRRVLVPLFLFLSIMVALLIAHTIFDPWTWQRILIRDIPAETFGQCTSQHTWAYFGPMAGLLFFMEFVMMYLAWKNRSGPDDFFHHGTIMYTCFARLQAWLVGGSILAILGDSSVNATYFGRIVLIWIFSMSCPLGLVGPKVFQALWIRCHPDLYDKRYTGRVNMANTMYFRNYCNALGAGTSFHNVAPSSTKSKLEMLRKAHARNQASGPTFAHQPE
jgi:hypothetical protein